MRQKYVISRDTAKNSLNISEYAILTRIPKNSAALVQTKDKYSLLGQETYDSDTVTVSISKGKGALVETLRTNNLFPIKPYANEIAKSVIALYKSSNDDSTELFFDDVDLLPVPEDQNK